MQQFIERILVGRSNRQTIAKHASGLDRYVGVLTIVSACLLGIGAAAPIATVDGFYGLKGQYSLFTAAMELLEMGRGSYALALAVIFGVIPIFSIATVFDLWYKYELHAEKTERMIPRAGFCNRIWFLVMLATLALIYYVSQSSEDAILHMALYYLLLSVMLQKITLSRLTGLLDKIKYVREEP